MIWLGYCCSAAPPLQTTPVPLFVIVPQGQLVKVGTQTHLHYAPIAQGKKKNKTKEKSHCHFSAHTTMRSSVTSILTRVLLPSQRDSHTAGQSFSLCLCVPFVSQHFRFSLAVGWRLGPLLLRRQLKLAMVSDSDSVVVPLRFVLNLSSLTPLVAPFCALPASSA